MTPERWQQITELFHRALSQDEASRSSFLDAACGGDGALRDEVSALLAGHRRAVGREVHPIVFADDVVTPGTTLGRYRIEGVLGRGGMGSVFLAYDTTLHRQVAVKVLDGLQDEATARERLLREARNAAALNHPNICTIHEIGEANGTAFIAMEYVEGRSLRAILDEGGLPVANAIRYGMQAAGALAAAHEHGVVHRDFKAANVIVGKDGRITIVDFGLARRREPVASDATKMTSVVPAGAAAGTPYAMAPEQVRGEPADERTDIWALGVLLYEMASGARPFEAASLPDLFSSILRDRPAPLPEALPAAMTAIIERCLAKDPAGRYQRAREVHVALATADTAAVAKPIPVRRRAGRAAVSAASALLAVLAALFAMDAGGVRDRLRRRPVAAAAVTLAVLPFDNLTGDPAQEFFSDGLTEEMISQLGRLNPGRLHVIARTSSMRYKRSSVPLEQIGGALGADYVLEGSARREGRHVRISATLIRVRDQTQQWTDTFDRDLAGILGLQSDVSRAVATSLALTLLPDVKQALAAAKPVDPEAYEAYLSGRNYATRLTRPDLDKAEKYFEHALSRDPTYALAYVGLSLVWSGRQQMQFVAPEETAPRVRAAASKALELDETLPEGHLQLANTHMWTDWNWVAAEREFRRAIELRPNYAEARAYYSHYLYIMRRVAEAQEQMRQATESDPLSEFVQSFAGVGLILARRFGDAELQLREVLKTNPNSPMALNALSGALHALGRYDDALEVERTRWNARGDLQVVDALRRGAAEAGYAGALRRAADLQAARSQVSGVLPVAVATLYARAGQQTDREIEWLERAVETRDPNVPYIGALPFFDHLRDLPRFQRLLARLRLPT